MKIYFRKLRILSHVMIWSSKGRRFNRKRLKKDPQKWRINETWDILKFEDKKSSNLRIQNPQIWDTADVWSGAATVDTAKVEHRLVDGRGAKQRLLTHHPPILPHRKKWGKTLIKNSVCALNWWDVVKTRIFWHVPQTELIMQWHVQKVNKSILG